MVKVIIASNNTYQEYEGNFYFAVGHGFERIVSLKQYFKKVILVGRRIKGTNFDVRATLANCGKADFCLYESENITFSFLLHRKYIRSVLQEAVARCDCAILYSSFLFAPMLVALLREAGKPYLVIVTRCPWDLNLNRGRCRKLVAPYMWFRDWKLIWNASHVIYVTSAFLQKRYPTKGTWVAISNVVLRSSGALALRERIDSINVMRGFLVIGTAATLARHKGQQYVIKALAMLKKQGITTFKYQLVGPGDQSYLRHVAMKCGVVDQVEFLGGLPHADLFDWLDTIDIYAQPSRMEGLPRALIEAMSRGLPAIGARTGGIPELLDPSFVHGNSYREVNEIVNLLMRMQSTQTREEQARRNLEEAKKYDVDLLDRRRRGFIERFMNETGSSNALDYTETLM